MKFSQTIRHHYFFAALGYLCILSAVFGLEPFINSQKLIFGDDLHLSYYFFRSFFKNSIASGEFPWWNPYLFSGMPFAAHPQALQIFYPVHWLFAVFPTSIMFAWYIAGHILIAMLGMYWLAVRFINKSAAFISGIVFGLSGFFMARIWAGHVDMIAASAYLPLVFGLFWNAINRGKLKYIALAGLGLGLQLFVGYQTVALMTLEAIGITALILSVVKKSFGPLMRFVTAVLLGVGIASVQLIPQQEFLNRSIRSFPFPYDWASGQHLTTDLLKLLISPFFYGDQRSYIGPWPNLAEYSMYIGLVPLGLAFISLIGISIRKKRLQDYSSFGHAELVSASVKIQKRVRDEGILSDFRVIILILLSIAVFSLWISFADKAPVDLLHILWKYIPVYHSLRIPVRHLLLFVFSTSLLAGFTLYWFKNKFIILAVGVAVLIDLVPFARHFMELRDIPEIRHDQKLISYLKNDTSLYRILPNYGVWLEPRSSLDFDSAMIYKLFSTTGYDPSILRNYYEFIDAAGGHATSSYLEHNVQVPYLDINSDYINFLNIKYLFVPNWLDPLGGSSTPRYQLVTDDPGRGYRLYENKNVLPRFFFVPGSYSVINRETMAYIMADSGLDLSAGNYFISKKEDSAGLNPNCPTGLTDAVKVLSYKSNSVRLLVNAPCDGYMVSSEVMYPGWEVTIDGQLRPIVEGDLAFRTVFMLKGQHEVTFRYNPKIFLYGGGISAVCFLITFYLYRYNNKFT